MRAGSEAAGGDGEPVELTVWFARECFVPPQEHLDRVVSGLRFVRGLAILPYIVSSVAAALMFRTLFNSDFGLPNRALELVGLEGLPWFSTPGLRCWS